MASEGYSALAGYRFWPLSAAASERRILRHKCSKLPGYRMLRSGP